MDIVAVIGMSDIEMSQYSNPPLTTYHVPKEEIGKVAANLLLARIQGYESLPQKIILHTSFVERSSTCFWSIPFCSYWSTIERHVPSSYGSPAGELSFNES